MTDTAANKAQTGTDKPARMASPWVLAIGGVLALLAIGTLFWIIPIGRTIVSGTDRRNQADLAIATAGLEQWSGAVAGLARANFIKGQAVPLPKSERDSADGWGYRTWLRHPTLDEFKITYVVTTPDECARTITRIEGKEGTLPFVANYNDGNASFLKIVDSFPLAQIRNDDQRGRVADTTAAAYLKTIDPDAAAPPKDAVVCFSAGIPVDRLLAIDKAARGFSNLLIIDSRDRVVVQVGTERLPVKSLAALVPEGSVLARTVSASTGKAIPTAAPARIADSLKPVDLEIGSRSYIAYVRPLTPPPSFRACIPPAARVQGQTTVTSSANANSKVTVEPAKPGTEPTATPQPPANACLVVALMPRATLWRQVIDLPLSDRVFVGIALVAFIALLPSLRLILLGPGEAIGRAEAIGVALGLPAVVSMATLALLLANDINGHQQAARVRAERIASAAATAAGSQIRQAVLLVGKAGEVSNATDFPPRLPDDQSDKIAGMDLPIAEATTIRWPQSASRDILPADPVPMSWPDRFCQHWQRDQLPVIDSMGLVAEDGRQLPGSRTIACRQFLGGRSNVSARDYFARLRNGDRALTDGTVGENPYVIAQVTALQDGVSKAVIAMQTDINNPDRTHRRQQRANVFVIGTATLSSVIQPVLPPGFDLMIVDTRDPALPVLVHSTPGRSGAERLATMVRDPDTVREQLRLLLLRQTSAEPAGVGDDTKKTPSEPVRFRSYYDGANRQFVAAPIAGTRWAAIVTYSAAEVDRESADTALHALRSWAAFSILFTLAWTVWLAAKGTRGWPRLWPQQRLAEFYPSLAKTFATGAAGGALLILLLGGIWPALVLLLGLVVRLAAAVWLHRKLGQTPAKPVDDQLLTPKTERTYTLMLLALIGCLSIVPMLGFWREAHEHVVEEYRTRSLGVLVGTGGAIENNRQALARLRWAYGQDEPNRNTNSLGRYDVAVEDSEPVAADNSRLGDLFSPFFDSVIGRPPLTRVQGCSQPAEATTDTRLCAKGSSRNYGIETPQPSLKDFKPGQALIYILTFAATILVALALFVWLLGKVLRSLAGFGVPLEAFKPPPLYVGDLFVSNKDKLVRDPDAVLLGRKSLLVNAPHIIKPILRKGGIRVASLNVAESPINPVALVEGMVMLVTGLDLVLADRERRLNALRTLERQCAALSQIGHDTKSRLVILSEAAPLERILNAYERDMARDVIDTERENLRWSQLFEDFATFNFHQSQLTGSKDLDAKIDKATKERSERDVLFAACAELRWLPQHVAGSVIGQELLLDNALLERGAIPIKDSDYQAKFEPVIIDWVLKRGFPSKAAVRAHVRNQCIEYYQKLWSSSSHAEHLVMHNLANGRFVNIATALAFVALVRRGIVIFDPEPRLMNESFAMFVRQAEKLDTIRNWRSELPRGAWMIARLPIFALIGAVIAGLFIIALLSGEDILSLLPIFAAGIPALIAATQRVFSRA